mgnify:FL=1|jgi:hypothetical protein
MEIIKGLYLNTDKIIIGKEYKVIYKYNDEEENGTIEEDRFKKYILEINKEKYELQKSEIGYIVNAVFRKENNQIEIYSIFDDIEKKDRNMRNTYIKDKITAIVEPENLKKIYSYQKSNDLLVTKKSKNIFAFSEQVFNAINKALRSFSKSFRK